MKKFLQILKSTFSNETAITGARHRKWYVAISIALISLVLSVVPSFVQAITTKGDAPFASYDYGSSTPVYAFFEDVSANNVEMTVQKDPNGDNFLSVTNWVYGSEGFVHKHNDVVDFTVHYRESFDVEQYNTIYGEGNVSFIIFYQNNFLFHVANPVSKQNVTTINSINAYKDFSEGYSLVDNIYTANDIGATWSNMKSFVRTSYNYNRVRGAWATTGLLCAINAVVVALMGLLLFILTRGKQNVFRPYSYWDTTKISFWAMLGPAILTLACGFIFKRFANLLFPMLIGIRVMWISMKQLRPDGSGYQEPKEIKTVNVK